MTDNGELHVVFGTGAVGMSVMDELVQRSPRRVRMVNRSGRVSVPEGVEVVGGDATDEAFAREASQGASVVYFALNPPYNKWPELFPPLQAGVLEGAASAGAKLIAMENLYMYGSTDGRPITEDLPHAPNSRKGRVRARMSQELMEAHRSGRVRVAIGRASDYFGPRVLTSAAGEQVFGSGCAEQERPASRGPRPAPHLLLRPRHRQRVGYLGRTRGGTGAGVAPAQPRDAHNAPVRGDDLRRSRQACTHPGGTEDGAAGYGSFQPRNPRDDRDALRVRGTIRGGSLQVRRGVRRASDAA